MNTSIYDLLAAELGDAVSQGPGAVPRVAPASADGVAATLGLADRHGWRVRVEGAASWMPPDAPADLVLTTGRLDRLVAVAPADLVATAESGIPLARLSAQLRSQRTRLAIDPPGSAERTLGSVLATGTGGAGVHRDGPVRDQVLGLTVATADGRLVRSGGSVVKNVAGFDLPKVQVGGFGGFGVIVEAHLRLRSLPAAERTFMATGALDPLFQLGRTLVGENLDASVTEMYSPEAAGRSDWLLVVGLAGTPDGVAAETARAITIAAREGASFVEHEAFAPGARFDEGAVTLRAGALPTSMPDTVDLVLERLGPGRISFGLGRGGLRWSGPADPPALLGLRAALAEREIPMTIERAPWPTRSAVGHFGAYRPGVAALAARVRDVFDPGGVLVAPLDRSTDG